MDLLLRCNQRLVSSGLDEGLVLQQTLGGNDHAADSGSVTNEKEL